MNKNKIKNIALGVSLGLNILLGFFLGGGLISSCTAKKAENPASSVSADASGEILDPSKKRALDPDLKPSDYPNLWDSLQSRLSGQGLVYTYGGQTYYDGRSGNSHIDIKRLPRAGLYYIDIEWTSEGSDGGFGFINSAGISAVGESADSQVVITSYVSNYRVLGYVVVDETMANSGGFFVSCQPYNWVKPKVYFIGGADIPPKVTLDLGAEWSPIAWLSNRASENYALLTTSFDDPQNTSFRLGFEGLIFSTMNDDRWFDALRVTYRPLWTGARYTYGGETLAYTYDNNAEFRLALVTGVEYRDILSGNWFNVANSRLNMLNPASPIFTALLDWVSPQYRTLRFWEYPTATLLAPTIQEATYNAGVSWERWGRAPTRYGLDFFGWLGLDPYGYVETNAGIGDAFTLLSGAFTAVGGILNIQILPFLTLGTLIFVPLVVLIILAILRLLAK